MPPLKKAWYSAYGRGDDNVVAERVAQDFSNAYKNGRLDEWVSQNCGPGHDDILPRIMGKDYKPAMRNESEEKAFRTKELKELLAPEAVKIHSNISLDGSMYKSTATMATIIAPDETLGIIEKTIIKAFPEARRNGMEVNKLQTRP